MPSVPPRSSPWDGCADLAVTSQQKHSQGKGAGSDRGIYTSTNGGKVKPHLELPGWLNNREKIKIKMEFELGCNLEITRKWQGRNKSWGVWPGNASSKEKLPH